MKQSKYIIPSVQRALKILEIIASSEQPKSISEIGNILGIPKSTTFRIIATLEAESFVMRSQEDKFHIGVSAFEVGSAYSRNFDLESAFNEVTKTLMDIHNETIQLAILIGTEILYIGKKDSSRPIRLVSDIGDRLPAHCTALGKAILSTLERDEICELYGDKPLQKFTNNTHQSVESLLEDLAEIRMRGWAHDNEEVSEGLQCVGSPIFANSGSALAAISISVPSQRIDPSRLVTLGLSVKEAASQISQMLHYHSSPVYEGND